MTAKELLHRIRHGHWPSRKVVGTRKWDPFAKQAYGFKIKIICAGCGR